MDQHREMHSMMEVKIMLRDHQLFTSTKGNTKVYYKGSASSKDGELLSEGWLSLLPDVLDNAQRSTDLILLEKLSEICGLFSMIIMKEGACNLAVDIIRSNPLFYGFHNNALFITDNLYEFQKFIAPLPVHEEKLEEFIFTGFVLGSHTVYRDVFAIQAGEIVTIENNQVSSKRYFTYFPKQSTDQHKDDSKFTQALDQLLLSVFSRMIKQTPHINRWLVPLSGGHDSRIIVNTLFKLGVRNVVCYTYGTKGNEQSFLSKQVAEALGFEWHFVEYSEQKWDQLHREGVFDHYLHFAFNGVSTPHLQDILAVYELKHQGVIQHGDVFVPGHSLDLLAGCWIENEDFKCRDKLQALQRTTRKWVGIKEPEFVPSEAIEKVFNSANVAPHHFQEYFNWQEFRTKFVVNSIRGYEFFGFEFRLPYWDKELVDFWLAIAPQDKTGRKMLFDAEKKGILVHALTGIPFAGKTPGKSIVKSLLRKLVPDRIKNILLSISGYRIKINEGLNQIYALKARTVKEMLEPIEDFPWHSRSYLAKFNDRHPGQANYNSLTAMYTVRKLIDLCKN